MVALPDWYVIVPPHDFLDGRPLESYTSTAGTVFELARFERSKSDDVSMDTLFTPYKSSIVRWHERNSPKQTR